jgi:hypothetical protein
MSAMSPKRPIDRQRESAVMMDVGTAEDTSAVVEMVRIGSELHIIKEKGIYICKLADDVDPGRTNPSIPNVQQRILTYGSDSTLVRQTVLTAKKLFSPSYLPDSFDHARGLILAMETLKELAAMQDIANAFLLAENSSKVEDRRQRDGSIVLPTVGDVAAHCKSFIQKSDHALQSLNGIVKLFYGKDAGKQWFESLTDLVQHRYGPDDLFSKFMVAALPFLKFIRNARNCVEHPSPAGRGLVVTTDFALNAQLQIIPPTIAVVDPKTPQPAVQVSKFMTHVIEQVTGIFEAMVAHMCNKNTQPFAGIQFQVIELPEDWQRAHHVRYSYGLYDGDRVIPAG